MKKVLAALLVFAALFSSSAASASAAEADDVAAVPVVDALNRTENPLSNSGKWVALQWTTATTKTGRDYGAGGWGPELVDTHPKVAGAYWTTAPGGNGVVASGVTMNASPGSVGRYISVWLDMPNPGGIKSGYELRWTYVSSNTYSVKLSKWVAGEEKELASNASVSIPVGTRLMISDSGGTVTAWKGSGSTLTSLLTASDSTYSGGYAGIEASGNGSRSLDFRVGSFEPNVYWGAWIGGSVYSAEEEEFGDAPWDGETWDFFEEDAGSKPVSLIHFGQPAPWSQEFAAYPLELTRARGALPVMSMYSNGATLKEIAEGKKDAALRAWAEAAAEYAHPFFFVWNPQMNGTWYQHGEEAAASPQTYKEAWWHFHDVVEEEEAVNVTWTWCPNTVYTGSTSLSSLYPGKASEGKSKYVDWTCISGYNRGTNPINPDSWKSFSTVFSATYIDLTTLASEKPVMIGETASSEFGGSKASWITDALSTQVPVNFPKIKAFVWWNKDESGMDWPIESSPTAEAAFGNSIAPSFYAENDFGGIPAGTPISPLPSGSAPGMATVSSVTPAGPANNNIVTVKGAGPTTGTAIHLYTESSCAGMPIASTRPETYASTGIKVSVADNTTTTFYAEATNSWGYSPCSATSATYVEDSAPPAKPSVTSTNPASPANNNAPKVIGSAEAGSTVKLYTNNTCTSAVAATGTAAAFASPGLSVSVADNTTTTFYATATDVAGNVSGCSTVSVTYKEDSTAPAAPTVSSTNPASGANNNSPKVIGSAVAETTVKIYATNNCTGSPLATGTAAAFASPGIAVSIADNSTTTFKATATDTANNTSACSSTSVTYVEGTPKIYWGAWMGGNAYDPEEEEYGDAPWDYGTWDLFEEHADKEVSIVHFGQPAPWNQAFAEGPLKLTRERGAIPLMDMDPDGVTLKEIVEGKKDSHFKTWATAVKNYAHPMFFRWAWEMNGTWFQWGAEAAKNPTLYKEVWVHLHKLFAEQGAANITWVWCPNLKFSGSTSYSSLYPGDAYVDWTCLDGYNFGTNPAQPDSWKSFSTLYTASYEELLSLAPSKPIMIGEMGSTEYGGEKSAWITDAIGTQIPKNFPAIKAVVWFNRWDGGRDWPIETSASAETAFANAIDAPIYAGNTFGSLPTLEKIKPLP
jgi:beta-mannanase